MKTTVFIPDDVLQDADRLARLTNRSRSRLFTDALKECLARHTPDKVTEAMNGALSQVGEEEDSFVSSVARALILAIMLAFHGKSWPDVGRSQ